MSIDPPIRSCYNPCILSCLNAVGADPQAKVQAVLRFCLLGSGSGGNATLVVTPHAKILIDNGLSFKQLEARAASVFLGLDGLKAVFVTHEHSDHVLGLGVLSRRLGVPVYMTPRTYASLPGALGKIDHLRLFEAGERVSIDGVTLESFSVSHDAADPVSYVVHWEGRKVGLAADLGRASTLVRMRLSNSNALVLESNYCPSLLRKGTYPPSVQQRIRSRHGHLSNIDMSSLLSSLLHEGLRIVVLVHLSEENNLPSLAYKMARQVVQGTRTALYVARQNQPSPVFEIA
jgi:phosphoribosyl 1,2-cyclic phosphodiesterase